MQARQKGDWLARLALTLLVLVLFREALAGGVLYRRDIHQIWVPQVEAFVTAVAGGALPLWDPSPAFGQPLLADPSSQVLYPATWLNLVLQPWRYYTLFALGHVLFSVLCCFALARRWGLSRLASATAAAVWGLSGPLVSLVDLWHHFASACYLPLVFLVAGPAFVTRKARDVVRLGLVLSLQILAGSADVAAMTIVALAIWAAVVHVRWGEWREASGIALAAALPVVLAGVISAGLWVAALEAVSRSSRQALPAETRTYWSLHPVGLVEILLAGVPGALPLSPHAREALTEGREPFLASLYLGLPCLAFVGMALSLPGGSRRRWALVAIGLGALLVALGRHAPFYDLAVGLVPPLRVLRYPVKAMVMVAFSWAGLVGFGVDACTARLARAEPAGVGWPRRHVLPMLAPLVVAGASAALAAVLLSARPALVAAWIASLLGPPGLESLVPLGRGLAAHAALGMLVVLLAFARPRSGGGASLAVGSAALVAVADLLLAHPRPNPVAPAALYEHRPEIVDALRSLHASRVYSYEYSDRARPADVPGPDVVGRLRRRPAGWSAEAVLALAQQASLASQAAGRWRLRQGFDVDYRGLHPEALAYLTRLVRLREQHPDEIVRLLRLCAVTHVIAQHRIGGDRLSLVAEVPGFFALPTLVLAVPDAMPRARVVGGVRVADGLAALGELLEPGFDPERMVLLPEGRAISAPPSFHGSARIVDERADRVRIEADLSSDGYVVLTDTYDPGWRARVDGREAPLLRADVAFRAVAVPSGRHSLEMIYRPTAVLVAVAVSLFALLATIFFLLVSSRVMLGGSRA